MRLAFISDVHSNAPALNTFLEIIAREDVDGIYCAGDVVGYNPYPNEVIALFREKGIVSIAGNHDTGVTRDDFSVMNHVAAIAGKWTATQLSASSFAYLRTLKQAYEIQTEAGKVQIFHGSPQDPYKYIYPEMIGDQIFTGTDADILVLGHTHVQFSANVGGKLVFNPGSIGQPRDGNWRPGYAILEIDNGHARVRLHRFEYDVDEVVARIRATGLPEVLAQRLLGGW
jgi:putative phosphoesterase